MTMKTYNCIVVFNHDKTKALFCRRIKNPFKGKLNFVGGKVEAGESEEDAAYRERFAGEQNIAHIMNIAMAYPLP